jgi:hypothetical protein
MGADAAANMVQLHIIQFLPLQLTLVTSLATMHVFT